MKISRLAVGDRTLPPSHDHLSGARRPGAGPPHRRPAARHARRHARPPHLPARRRVRVQHRRRPRRRAAGARRHHRRRAASRSPNPARLPHAVTAGPHTIGVADRRSAARRRRRRCLLGLPRADTASRIGGGVQSVDDHRAPSTPTGAGDTPSRRRIFVCRPAPAAEEDAVRADDPARRWRAAPIAAPVTAADDRHADGRFYRQGRHERRLRDRHPARARARAGRPALRLPHRRGAGRACRRRRVSHQRSRTRLAAVVLPVEQHSRRRAAGRWRAKGRLRDAGRARAPGAAHAGRPEGRRRSSTTSPASGCTCASSPACRPKRPDFDDNLRQAFRRETEMLFGSHRARGPQPSSICSTPTTRSSTSGWRGTTASRTSAAATSGAWRSPATPAPRPARAGQHADRHVGGDRTSPVMRGKWILENLLGAPPPEPPPGVETNSRSKAEPIAQADHAAAAAGSCTAPTRSARRATTSWTRSGSRWRTSTSSAGGASRTTARADRLDRPARRRHAARRSGRPAPRAARAARTPS